MLLLLLLLLLLRVFLATGQRRSIDRVLPANERGQGRWNSNPFDVSDVGGDGSRSVLLH